MAKEVIDAPRASYAKEYVAKKKSKINKNKEATDTAAEPEATEDDDLPQADAPVVA